MELAISTPPNPGAILCGAVVDTAGTLITIPANRTWVGEIVVSVAVASTAARNFQPNVVTPNTAGVFPQNRIVAQVVVQTGATSGTSVADTQAFKVIVANTTGSPINLTTVLTGESTTETTATFTANGIIL